MKKCKCDFCGDNIFGKIFKIKFKKKTHKIDSGCVLSLVRGEVLRSDKIKFSDTIHLN